MKLRHFSIIFIATQMASPAVSEEQQLPKLVLQITVDQLRGDQLTRYQERFGEGGFRYLMEQGVYFTNANYEHANTETIVGHTSLATGAVPATHGMVANVWFDHELGRLVYNIEDPRYHLLSAGADVDKRTEIDHTQMAAKSDGRSPSAILTSTLSDEMAIHFGGISKIFGVSVKDRGAVALAGHAGKAFWFSKASGEFVTSNYYYDRYPEWVSAWNSSNPAEQFSGTSWNLLHDAGSYLFGGADNRPYETNFPGYGRVFPHTYGTADDKYFTTRLTLGPAGDRLTLKFARELINQEKLGKDKIPDYLAISFSATDYVGHVFGPSSLEMEDNLLQLDRTIADLLRYVEDEIGLEQTLIVLSADHGAPEAPGYLNELGMVEAHYFEPEKMDKSPIMTRLKKRFGIGSELITQYFHPYVYLNRQLINEMGLDQVEIEQAVAETLGANIFTRDLLSSDNAAQAVSTSQMGEHICDAITKL